MPHVSSILRNKTLKVIGVSSKIISMRIIKEVRHSFTTDLLLAQDIKPILAVFSILEPGAQLDPHADGDKRIDPQYMDSTVYKFHLSLDIPEDGDSALVCGGETRVLSNGDLNVFDEEGEHYAYNKSTGRRGVLIVSYIKAEIDK